MNRTEEVTFELCRKTFLSMWSIATPTREDRKELCDILVVSDPNIIIFSVKEIRYAENKSDSVASSRWQRKAIEESVKQIYKAEKWLRLNRRVLSRDGKPLSLPDLKNARIYRVAIGLGSKGKVNLQSGDFGRGFVHIHDERSISLVLRELDTITDVVDYLDTIETLTSRSKVLVGGGEENLLAYYLQNSRSFPTITGVLIVPGDAWNNFDHRVEVQRRRREDKVSRLWDEMIDTFARDAAAGVLEYSPSPTETEQALRTMA